MTDDTPRRGRGRPRVLSPDDEAELKILRATTDLGYRPLAKLFGTSRSTIRRALARE